MNADGIAPPPAQRMTKPATPQDLRGGLLLGLFCLGIFGLGMVMWVWGPEFLVGSGTSRTQTNAIFIMIAAPIMLVAGIYFLYRTWHDRRRSARFRQYQQRGDGIITHRWIDKNANGRKIYCLGYQYGDNRQAYQEVGKRRYDSLAKGDKIRVNYLPDDPTLGYFEPDKRKTKSKRKAES
ncbi:MAG: hypothetical protein K8I60_08915 [Anaerolineae bacterium]|nr:hypothetical protein [Anaerolineae bacterium]